MSIKEDAEQFEAYLAQLGYVKPVQCKECVYDHRCTHEMVMRRIPGGSLIYCPVEYCSEGKRKEE